MHDEFLRDLQGKVEGDGRVRAAWLEGSFGTRRADRYSDIDLHLLVAQSDLESFRTDIEAWLGDIRPLVLFTRMFEGRMINAMTRDGLRLDIWSHGGKSITVDEPRVRVLHAAPGMVQFSQNAQEQPRTADAAAVEAQIKEWWRCLVLLPVIAGRGELISGFFGVGLMVNLLTNVLIDGYGIPRDRGVKNINPFLPDGAQEAIEAALSLDGLSPASLARAQFGMARVMQQHGPRIAERLGFTYPIDLEMAVLGYVHGELERLGIDVDAQSL